MGKTITDELSALKLEISQIELPPKTKTKLIKQVDHISKKTKSTKRERKPDAPPSQFERLRVVDDAMADFAGWEKGSAHSRVDITKSICAYIKDNKLQVEGKGQGRFINVDDKLGKLLGYTDSTIKYPHIQKYVGAHFVAEQQAQKVQ